MSTENVIDPTTVQDLELAWRVPLGGYASSPVVVDGTLYAGSTNGKLYALDALSGAQIWATQLSGAIGNSPAAVAGIVYASTADGKLHALDEGGEHLVERLDGCLS